jgi:hypothetical protein
MCTLRSTDPLYREEPTQVIEGHYLDPQKLMNLLRDVYGTSNEGKNNFRVEVRDLFYPSSQTQALMMRQQLRLNRYKIYPSKHVSDDYALTEVTERMFKGWAKG